jgi:four helix bundle protein
MDDTAMDNELAAWDSQQAPLEKADPIWTLLAYRLSRYLIDLTRHDLGQARGISWETRDQLTRAVASVAATMAEGHARTTPRERARYYTISLGSAREAGVWYASISAGLPDGIADARTAIIARIKKLLFGLIKKTDAPRWGGPRRKRPPTTP